MAEFDVYPIPKRRFQGRRWRIYWYYANKKFSIATNFTNPTVVAGVDADLRQISAALAKDYPDFPEKYVACTAVKKYTALRYGEPDQSDEARDPIVHDFAQLLEKFKEHSKHEYSKGWCTSLTTHLTALKNFVPDLGTVTPALARDFLADIRKKNSAATRNRALAACNTFYNWLIQGEYLTSENPFRAIKQLSEPRGARGIVYCTRQERQRIIAMAKKSMRPDWCAIPLAFFGGFRRGEIYRLEQTDIFLQTKRAVVRISKTDKSRPVPLSKELNTLLSKQKDKRGFVVPRLPGEGWENQSDRLIEILRECLCLPLDTDLNGYPLEPVGKRRFAKTEDQLEKKLEENREALEKARKKFATIKRDDPEHREASIELARLENIPTLARDGKPFLPAERIGWNAFRHTFGSLLAQAGVSLDKITSWMGNTPDVCRRHYAQFVPRDSHDEDIEKL